MKRNAIFLFVLILVVAEVQAIPEIYPFPGAEFTATIGKIKQKSSNSLTVVVVLTHRQGLSESDALVIYSALRHKAGYRVRYPRTKWIELVFWRKGTEALAVGDRVRISAYSIYGHSELDGAWLGATAKIEKVESPSD